MRRSGARATAAALGASLYLCLFAPEAHSQPSRETAADPITLERIASDLDWLGNAPERAYWAEDGASVFYSQKRTGERGLDLVELELETGETRVVPVGERGSVDVGGGRLSRDRRLKVYAREGNIWAHDLVSGQRRQLTRTHEDESDPWPLAQRRVAYRRGARLLVRDLSSGLEEEPFVLLLERDPAEVEREQQQQAGHVERRQRRLFDVLRVERDETRLARDREQDARRKDPTLADPAWYLGDDVEVRRLSISPDERWLLLTTASKAARPRLPERVPRYVTDNGQVATDPGRPKAEDFEEREETLWLLDRSSHERVALDLSLLPGMDEDPLADLRRAAAERREAGEGDQAVAAGGETTAAGRQRPVHFWNILWSDDGARVAVQLFSLDCKDRWISEIDLESRRVVPIVRMHDPAWVTRVFRDIGWLRDGRTLFYLSEESGYSHLVLHPLDGGERRRITEGTYTVSRPTLSRDGRHLYFTANRVHPGVWEVYRADVSSGQVERLTDFGGVTTFAVSPDGQRLLLTVTRSNRPAELYVQRAEAGATARQLTHTTSHAFLEMPWVVPELVAIPSPHTERPIYARLYRSEQPASASPPPAVFLVHAAGYFQNAHAGWEAWYAREFMFHSLLVQRGYVVLEMDYRASRGYGRDWRTAIYRHMGEPEVQDLEVGVDWLVRNHGVDRRRIGLYGDSYGGFLTLMAMFKRPQLFSAGAAINPVTDWGHYNYPWTSDILNPPELDPEAYRRSSPIEYAAGLERPLLISHGMVDRTVHFQDTIQLVQRLIELEKKDWELAVYPLESHGFVHPTSWLDRFRRILELFETHLEH